MPKLYTKNGDNGTTCLYDMRRINKNNNIINALGDLDELSAHIGLLCAQCTPKCAQCTPKCAQCTPKCENELNPVPNLRLIQHKLLDIGSNIATKVINRTTYITEEDIKAVEDWIDICEEQNTPLKEFILPGVHLADAQAHVCRAVCRRFERGLVSLHFDKELNKKEIPYYVDPQILQYVNRLSDYFFALSRYLSGCKETTRNAVSK